MSIGNLDYSKLLEMKNMISRILYLMKENNIKSSKLCSDLNIANSSITDWKKAKGKPSVDTINKISHYFNVSLDWLITGQEYNKQISSEDNELLGISHQLNSLGMAELKGFAKGLLTNKDYLKIKENDYLLKK